MLGKRNGDGASFLAFVQYLLVCKFFCHFEFLVMDNAAIHTGGDAEIVENLLWNHMMDGQPLCVMVVYLPAHAPELNPIELIFHILALQISLFSV